MTIHLQLLQSSFPDLCPVTAAVEELANAGGVEERGAIYTRREVVDFILDLTGYRSDRPLHDIRIATVMRAVFSRRQLFEVMTEFWHNHFSVYAWEPARTGTSPPRNR